MCQLLPIESIININKNDNTNDRILSKKLEIIFVIMHGGLIDLFFIYFLTDSILKYKN